MSNGAPSMSFAQQAAPALRSEVDAESLALALFDRLAARDLSGASGLFATDAQVDFSPADITGSFAQTGRPFLCGLICAFPDLRMQVRSIMGSSEIAVVEITVAGTQNADFLGIPNQRRRLEIDQAWVIGAVRGKIASIRAYWCHSQLCRRLGVRRLDQLRG